MADFTTAQIESIVLDSGVVYINYGETDERILAPCKGDNEFTVDAKYAMIEANGLKSLLVVRVLVEILLLPAQIQILTVI